MYLWPFVWNTLLVPGAPGGYFHWEIATIKTLDLAGLAATTTLDMTVTLVLGRMFPPDADDAAVSGRETSLCALSATSVRPGGRDWRQGLAAAAGSG